LLQAGLLQIMTPMTPVGIWVNLIQQPVYLTHLALPAFVVMAFTLLYKEHLHKNEHKKLQDQKLQEQREHMVCDIHDGVGSRINLLLWQLKLKPPSPAQIEDELRRCMDELRFAITPPHTGHTTLDNALQNLCLRLQAQCEITGLNISYNQTGTLQAIDTNTALQLYKIMQEAMANALRHSQASHLQIVLAQTQQALVLSLTDNGTGIARWDNTLQKQHNASSTSLGLQSLFNRAQIVKGTLLIHSSAQGTQVQVSIGRAATC
jgi:signal transduction histidine kinase